MHSRFLTNIQQLRGIAAMLVLMAHVIQSAQKRVYGDASFLIDGGIGVDIFFVISGFIMVGVTHDAYGQPGSSRNFAVRRFARIAPVYWLFTALLALLFIVAGDPPKISDLIASFLFFPLEHEGKVRPVLGQGWTLNLEVMFYVLFAVCLMFRRSVGLSILCGTLAVVPLVGLFITSGPLNFWTSPIIVEFLIGIVIALVYRRFGPQKFGAHLPLIGAIVAAWIIITRLYGGGDIYAWRIGAWCAAAGVVAIAVFAHQAPRGGSLSTLGDWSYSLYLVHTIILMVFASLSDRLLGERISLAAGAAYVLFVTLVSIMAAAVSYRWIERPTEKFFRQLMERRVDAGPALA